MKDTVLLSRDLASVSNFIKVGEGQTDCGFARRLLLSFLRLFLQDGSLAANFTHRLSIKSGREKLNLPNK